MDIASLHEQVGDLFAVLKSLGLGTEELVWLVTPIVALFIAVRGWRRADEDRRQREEKERAVLMGMLRHEVGVRWPKIEKRTLDDRILQFRDDNSKFVDQLAHRRLRSDEFFVIYSICKDYHKFAYLDSELLAMLMDAYATWLDIIDTRDNADHLIHEIQEEAWRVAALESESVEDVRGKVETEFAERLQNLAERTDGRITAFKQKMNDLTDKLDPDRDRHNIHGWSFVVCLKADDQESVEPNKIYRCIAREVEQKLNCLVIIDDAGQNRQVPKENFVPIELPRVAEEAIGSST